MANELVIEIDGDHNECLSFRPLQRRVRGRFDLSRDTEPQSKLAAGMHPAGAIPGQRIGWKDGKGFLEDPIVESPECEVLREQLKAKGYRLGPAREEFTDADEITWLFWLSKAVKAGVACIVEGTLPTRLDESKAKKNFVNNDQPTATDKLTAAIERQNELFEKLVERLGT